MQAMAKHRYARLSAQKGRLVADQIRGLSVEDALNVLMFSKKKGASLVKKVLDSAIAKIDLPSGENLGNRNRRSGRVMVSSSSPCDDHTLSTPSRSAVTMDSPEGENTANATSPSCPGSRRSRVPSGRRRTAE